MQPLCSVAMASGSRLPQVTEVYVLGHARPLPCRRTDGIVDAPRRQSRGDRRDPQPSRWRGHPTGGREAAPGSGLLSGLWRRYYILPTDTPNDSTFEQTPVGRIRSGPFGCHTYNRRSGLEVIDLFGHVRAVREVTTFYGPRIHTPAAMASGRAGTAPALPAG